MASFIIMAAPVRDAHVVTSLTRLASIASLIFGIVAVTARPRCGDLVATVSGQ